LNENKIPVNGWPQSMKIFTLRNFLKKVS
jgi:hypothetical protein